MRLIVGGISSGKLERIKQLGFTEREIFDCRTGELAQLSGFPAVYKLDQMIYRMMKYEKSPQELLTLDWQDKTVSCDEVGCGIVPTDPFELEYREQVGRICCELAKRAETVERMYCGIATKIK